MPIPEDADNLGVCKKVSVSIVIIILTFLKSSQAEILAINDISLALRSFYIKSSKWNSDLSEGNHEILLF